MSTSVTLELTQALGTTGARAAGIFAFEGSHFLAIPQYARDIPGVEPGTNNGDADVPLILYRTEEGTGYFLEYQELDVPGGRDAEFFTIGDRMFLAAASERSGSYPTYDMNVTSCIFEWTGQNFVEFACIPTWGAKQWRHFEINDRTFLALAQSRGDASAEEHTSPMTTNSTVLEWNGSGFQPFQAVPSDSGYNWYYFSLEGRSFLAHADDAEFSVILEWDGEEFVHFQTLEGVGGRAFCLFENDGRSYLAYSRVSADSTVFEWDGQSFQHHQTLEGFGGREFALIHQQEKGKDHQYLVQVKFLASGTDDPLPALDSVIYSVEKDGLHIATEFPTFGGTDVATFSTGDATYIVISEFLSEELYFLQDSHVYRFESDTDANITRKPRSERSPREKRQDDAYVSPEFMALFSAYAGGPGSIGYQFRNISAQKQSSNPLIVATAENMVLYPGNGEDPVYMNYRYGSAGFIEITAISHLGPAISSLAEIRAFNPESEQWRIYAEKLLNATQATKTANSETLWEDLLRVEGWQGREDRIAAMVNYACDLTIRLLRTVLADPEKLTADFVRENYLDATSSELDAYIPMNAVMIATFYLSAVEGALATQRVISEHDIDWTRVMILINGQTGRDTAGVVMSTNTLAQMFLKSHPELPAERIYISPHGLVPNITDTSPEFLRQFESELRNLWGAHRGYVDLAGKMFAKYPAYRVAENNLPVINSSTTHVSELPAVAGPDDWLALTTRLRVTLEDPRQPLSGCITDYATQQLFEAGWDVSQVIVPGLDGYDYQYGLDKLFV